MTVEANASGPEFGPGDGRGSRPDGPPGVVAPLGNAYSIPTDIIERDPAQPRQNWRLVYDYDPRTESKVARELKSTYEGIESLIESLLEHGVMTPLIVRHHPTRSGYYMLQDGGRRLHAIEHILGRTGRHGPLGEPWQRDRVRSVPAIVEDAPDANARVRQLVANVQRQDLTPLDEGRAYEEIMALEGWTESEMARRVGMSPAHVTNRVRVVQYAELRDAVALHQLSQSTAAEIVKLEESARDALLGRVRRGEKIALSDVQEARRRLAADGVRNPRRKIGAEAETKASAVARRDDPADELLRMAPWRTAPLTYDGQPRTEPPPGSQAAQAPSRHHGTDGAAGEGDMGTPAPTGRMDQMARETPPSGAVESAAGVKAGAFPARTAAPPGREPDPMLAGYLTRLDTSTLIGLLEYAIARKLGLEILLSAARSHREA